MAAWRERADEHSDNGLRESWLERLDHQGQAQASRPRHVHEGAQGPGKALGLGQVALDDPHLGRGRDLGQDRGHVRHDRRVPVDVHHPGTGPGTEHGLVHRRAGRQPGADIDELVNSSASEVDDGACQEGPRQGEHLRCRRVEGAQAARERPVGGEVRPAAEQVIVGPGEARAAGVDGLHGVSVNLCHRRPVELRR